MHEESISGQSNNTGKATPQNVSLVIGPQEETADNDQSIANTILCPVNMFFLPLSSFLSWYTSFLNFDSPQPQGITDHGNRGKTHGGRGDGSGWSRMPKFDTGCPAATGTPSAL